ncbi:MAG: ACP S-malonyltransferase [Spirochaetota bacterium]|nr:MAG: ACP S-malonyltransferase [Spirochaetota bacterium]
MTSYTFLFPGQGSQKPGMGKGFYEKCDIARDIFNRADKILSDCSVTALCFEADEEELRKTENTQPALFTVSYAIYSVLVQEGIEGDVFAGNSLGEYTAVAASGILGFEDGLRIVRKRGLLMRDCDPDQKGGMAAIIGMESDKVISVCNEIGNVAPANYNSPSQIVISGEKNSVKEAAEKLGGLGAKRTIILNVGGPFHSSYMGKAAEDLKKELEAAQWMDGHGKIISNVTAEMTDNPSVIKENLITQLNHPVLWNDSMQKLVNAGRLHYIESGPGGVLKGLFRSISKEANVYSVAETEDIEQLKQIPGS